MANKNNTWFKFGATAVIALLVGWFGAGALIEPEVVTVTETVEVPVEVAGETVIETVEVEIPLGLEWYLDLALDATLSEIQDDYERCGGERYNEDEISIDDVDDEWTLEVDDEDYVVTGHIEVEYDDRDKCTKEFDFEVTFEDDDVDVDLDRTDN